MNQTTAIDQERPRRQTLAVCVMLMIFRSLLPGLVSRSVGQYAIESSVVSAGGGEASADDLELTGTLGQPLAGGYTSGPPYQFYSGFWSPGLQTTSALVSVGGRVLSPEGRGLGGIRITLVGMDGTLSRAVSSPFGYYRFDGLAAGDTYVLTIEQSRYTFTTPSIAVHVTDTIADLDFVAIGP